MRLLFDHALNHHVVHSLLRICVYEAKKKKGNLFEGGEIDSNTGSSLCFPYGSFGSNYSLERKFKGYKVVSLHRYRYSSTLFVTESDRFLQARPIEMYNRIKRKQRPIPQSLSIYLLVNRKFYSN